MPYVAGIDFGTSNSSAAISDGGIPRMVDVENGADTIPTALFIQDAGRGVCFGRAARQMYTDNEAGGRFMRSIKRILGTSAMNGGTVINGRYTRFSEIIEVFIRHIKQRIDFAAGADVESVVIGRPVHFCDDAPDADARAQQELAQIARNAGFKNISFQYEPIAAAFAHERTLTTDKLAFVVDIGGGTSDFTVIRLGPGRQNRADRGDDVLANTGVRIGGNDFDKELAIKSFMPCFGMGTQYRSGDKLITLPTGPFFSLATWSAVNDVYNYKTLNMVRGYTVWGLAPDMVNRLYEIIENRLGHKNLDYVENAKVMLSSQTDVCMRLDFLSDAPTINTTRETFESAIKPDMDKILQSIEECIVNAGVKNTDIELVILTGGSTEIPCISNMMHTLFPNAVLSDSNKMGSVGLGLAYDAMCRYLGGSIDN